MKLLTIINTVLLLAVIGWLVYTAPSVADDEPAPVPDEAEYVVVSRIPIESFMYVFQLTDIISDNNIKETVGVYTIYDRDEVSWRIVGNLTVYRTTTNQYVVVLP